MVTPILLFGAEGRNCYIVNYNNKLINILWVYVRFSEFLNIPGRISAYQLFWNPISPKTPILPPKCGFTAKRLYNCFF